MISKLSIEIEFKMVQEMLSAHMDPYGVATARDYGRDE